MKKILLLWIFLFLASCSWNTKQVIKKDIQTDIQTDIQEKQHLLTWNQTIVKTVNNEKLTEYDKWIIKIALKKNNESICKNLWKKENLCKKIFETEMEYYKLWKCNKLLYLKQKCEDKVNYEELNCSKIKNLLMQRECNIQKLYEEAIKTKNKDLCNQLPRPKRNDCLKYILTR